MTGRPGLRERKKAATREALREAALRMALERGPENLRVEDIAEAAGVSPRTYNNYFSSREQAIVAGLSAERNAAIAAAVAARPASVRLSDGVFDAVVEQFTGEAALKPEALILLTSRSSLREAFVADVSELEAPLTAVIAARLGNRDRLTARVLAASVGAAIRVGLESWLQPVSGARTSPLVVPSGSLPELLRAALEPLRPSFEATRGEGLGPDQALDPSD